MRRDLGRRQRPGASRQARRYLTSLGHRPVSAPNAIRLGRGDRLLRRLAVAFRAFFRRVHIVTDAQRPAVLNAPRPGRCLARASRACRPPRHLRRQSATCDVLQPPDRDMVHRVPAWPSISCTSNDDVMLIKPVGPRRSSWTANRCCEDVLYRCPKRVDRRLRTWWRRCAPRDPGGAPRSARRPGAGRAHRRFADRFFASHKPASVRRSTFERYFAAHPDVMERNISPAARSSPVHAHLAGQPLELQSARITRQTNRLVYVKPLAA